MAIWADVQEAGRAAAEEAERLREALFGQGTLREGERAAAALHGRSLEGRKERIGLKHALAYEGRQGARKP